MQSANTGGSTRKRLGRTAEAQTEGQRSRVLARIHPESAAGEVRRPAPSYTVIRPQLEGGDDGDQTVLRPRELLAPIAAALKAANETKARATGLRTPIAGARQNALPPPIPMAPAPAMPELARVRGTGATGRATPASTAIGTARTVAAPAIDMRLERAPRSKQRSAMIAIAVCIIGASIGVAGAAMLNEQLTGPSAGESVALAATRAPENLAMTPASPPYAPPPVLPAVVAAVASPAATSCALGDVQTTKAERVVMEEPPPPAAAHVSTTHRTREQREAAKEAREAAKDARDSERANRVSAPRKVESGADEMAHAADALAKAQLESALR